MIALGTFIKAVSFSKTKSSPIVYVFWVGGFASPIAIKDLEGINNSDVIFVVLDNLDSGTLIESGYSMAKGKKIIVYHRTCEESKLLMLKPGNFTTNIYLTTALYQTIWSL